MAVRIRPLQSQDIVQVAWIERQAFPTLVPPTSFKHELESRMSKFLVACDPSYPSHNVVQESPASPDPGRGNGSWLGLMAGRLTGRRGHGVQTTQPEHGILGFVGLWFVVGEAHIISIAVEESFRGRGIGELLIIGSVKLALASQATVVSLEARVSNHVAQALYRKYDFDQVGIRKAYYTDNGEDAVIMTTRPINTHVYQKNFNSLVDAYKREHGALDIILGPGHRPLRP